MRTVKQALWGARMAFLLLDDSGRWGMVSPRYSHYSGFSAHLGVRDTA